MNSKNSVILFLSGIFILLMTINTFGQSEKDIVKGNLIQFNDNGSWCWYQDERVLVDQPKGKMILGVDESQSGYGGTPRNGVVNAVIFDLNTRGTKRFELWKAGCDDHNAAGFLIRPDGKYLAMYADHYDAYNTRYRIFDGTTWATEQRFNWMVNKPGGTNYTIAYNNVYYLSAENKLYDFSRANNRTPNFITSTNMGDTWNWGGQLTTNTSNSYNKGYYKYWSNGVDRIDFVFTEQHPRDTSTSMYHGYLKNGKTYNSNGNLADTDIYDSTFIPGFWNFTKIFGDNTLIDGTAMRRCWNTDVVRYDDGTIVTIITVRNNDNTQGGDTGINPVHSFIYCRYNDTSWSYTYLGKAGYKLYGSEADYTGLAAVHPNDPNTIYISTSFDPRDGSDISVREIFKGITNDNGTSWSWMPITQKSTRNNIRPVVPAWDNNSTALLWLRGTYISAQSFDFAVVGIIDNKLETMEKMNYVDASAINTTLSDGSPLVATGPDANAGANDNKWHERTGIGNGNSVFTSAELANENAPILKSNFTLPSSGTYDIWVNFWADPTSDWRIKGGLYADSMKTFRHMACKEVEPGDHASPVVLTSSGNLFLYQAYLGRVQATANSSLQAFIDDDTSPVGQNATGKFRTLYDGISYAKVNGAVLPVELTTFNGKISGSSVELFWQTKTETNNNGFEIERKDNGTWRTIGFVKGKGTVSETSDYSFFDKNIGGEKAEYRLKQIDFDGSFKYSGSIEVIRNIASDFNLSQNYPNPFNPATTISYSLPMDLHVNLKIYNLLGEEVATLVSEDMKQGKHSISWNASGIPSGIYYYKISAGEFSKSQKMILMR